MYEFILGHYLIIIIEKNNIYEYEHQKMSDLYYGENGDGKKSK